MDNHLVLETPSGNLSQIIQQINGAYTAYFNAKRHRSAHLLQGRHKAIVVDMDEYEKELSRYIHLNPVRAKLVDTVEKYPWSSYLGYTSKRSLPSWLARNLILSNFGKKTSVAQKNYHQFIEARLREKP